MHGESGPQGGFGGGQNGQPQEQHRDPKREESENFLHQLKLGLLEQETAPV